MRTKYKVGILGATGAVGQQFVRILDDHPWFEIAALAASERSADKQYREAVEWLDASPVPEHVREQQVVRCTPDDMDVDFVFSGLSASVAGDIERAFARAGIPVISNARNHRMDDDVPLLVPEVNPGHAALLDHQEGPGFIVTNPNCSTVGLVCALRPLVDGFGVEAVQVTTLQALSGAGYPGVSALDALGNVIPYIGGEEEKLAAEPLKLLGTLDDATIRPASLTISAQCNRVPVLNGHLECISVRLRERADVGAVKEAFETWESPIADLALPSAPARLLYLFEEEQYPQPRRHASLGDGMTVSIGRIRPCEVLDIKFIALVHNTVRGAAGGAVLNAELLVQKGYLASGSEIDRAVQTGMAT